MPDKRITTVACLGAGAMGHGVAFLAARAGYAVRLFARSAESLDRAAAAIGRAVAACEELGIMEPGREKDILGRIRPVTDIAEAVTDADLVSESVAENMEVKREVYALVEAACPEHAILTTNTSSLDLSVMAGGMRRPERFCAAHFFNPPYFATTVEVCPAPGTSADTIAATAAWVESLGHTPLIMKEFVQGYLVNRIQSACLREALYIVEQGWATAETVDAAVASVLGRRWSETGPIESADMGGLDVFLTVLDQICPGLSNAAKAPELLREAVAGGRLGLKNGRGLYEWPAGRGRARRAARERALAEFILKDRRKRGT